jgi:hypothetical protein
VFNNVQAYNNTSDGIMFDADNNILNNFMAYNNGGAGINLN